MVIQIHRFPVFLTAYRWFINSSSSAWVRKEGSHFGSELELMLVLMFYHKHCEPEMANITAQPWYLWELVHPHITVNWYVTITSSGGLAHMNIITSDNGWTLTSRNTKNRVLNHFKMLNSHRHKQRKAGISCISTFCWGQFCHAPDKATNHVKNTHTHRLNYHM